MTLSGTDATRTEPFDLIVRVFDDGFGFRYEFNQIAAVARGRHRRRAHRVPARPATGMPGGTRRVIPIATNTSTSARGCIEVHLAETPLTLQSPGLYLSIHEAALVDYASMNLRRTAERTLKADLMPWSDGVLVRKRGPFVTPWRTVLIADTPMAARRLAHRAQPQRAQPHRRHLLDPHRQVRGCLVGDASATAPPGAAARKHGATNANVKRYIDFAAKNGFGGVLVEGWNRGWDGDWIANGKHFSFTESYPDFDLPMLAAYARERGVRLIGHNETAGAHRELRAAARSRR